MVTHYYIKQMKLFRQEEAMEAAAAKEIRQLRHDMRQHLIYLRELLENGTLEEAQYVLIELIRDTKKQGRLEARTGNIVVDSMVNHAWKTAVFDYEIAIKSLINCFEGKPSVC